MRNSSADASRSMLVTYLVGGGDFHSVGGPEPPQDRLGYQIVASLASLEVAQASAGPNVGGIV